MHALTLLWGRPSWPSLVICMEAVRRDFSTLSTAAPLQIHKAKLNFSHKKTQSCSCSMESKVRAFGPNRIIAFRSKLLNKSTTIQTFAMCAVEIVFFKTFRNLSNFADLYDHVVMLAVILVIMNQHFNLIQLHT